MPTVQALQIKQALAILFYVSIHKLDNLSNIHKQEIQMLRKIRLTL